MAGTDRSSRPLPAAARPLPWGTALALLAGMAVAGCGNPCQQLCDEMANYAADCGYTVSPDQVATCKDDFAKSGLDEGTLQSCADHNDPDALREWWTCDDVAENFSASTQ